MGQAMTDAQRLAVCLLISLCIHYLAGSINLRHEVVSGTGLDIRQNQSIAPPIALSVALPLSLDSFQGEESCAANKETTPDERRQALKNYLEKVTREVHARRGSSLPATRAQAGNSLFSLCVDGQGCFYDIHMIRSSGQPALDKASLRAVQAASGVVTRPASLGSGPLRISLDVKFQFGL